MAEENNGPDTNDTQLIEGKALTYRLRLPKTTDDVKSAPLLVMMHGYGANEGDVYELVPYVAPHFMIVAPRAPLLYNDAPRGSFKWSADIDMSDLSAPDRIENSVQKVLALIEDLIYTSQTPIDPTHIYIGGFSQGAVMAYSLVSKRPDLFAGVIAHSSPFSEPLAAQLRQAHLVDKPFFVAHGSRDSWVNVGQGQAARQVLREVKADLTYTEYDLDHETSLASRQDLADWLKTKQAKG